MSHEELRDRLLDLAYGELSPREAREVEAHAASCEACGAELERIRGTRRLMSALPQEPAPERGERILLAAAREAARRRAPRPWVPRWAWGTAVAAASLLAVAAVSWRIIAMRPEGIGREDPRALMGESPYARDPGAGVLGDAKKAGGEEPPKVSAAPEKDAPNVAAAPEQAAPARRDAEARPPPRSGGEGRGEGAGPPRSAQVRRFAAPPPESPPPAAPAPAPAAPAERAPEHSEYAAAPPPPAVSAAPAPPPAAAPSRSRASEERPTAAARPQNRAMSAEATPPQAADEATRDEAMPSPSPPRSGVSRYDDLRRSGRLRGEIRTFPGCDGETWRKVERDPEGRIVSYAREGLAGGRRVRVDVVYGPDGAPARVTVRDAATMAPLDGATPWIPRAADADGPPRCGP